MVWVEVVGFSLCEIGGCGEGVFGIGCGMGSCVWVMVGDGCCVSDCGMGGEVVGDEVACKGIPRGMCGEMATSS